MLRLDKAWSLRELPECHRPTCDEHCRAPGDASDGDTATDGAASGTAALPAGAGGREGDGYTRSNKPCGVTREISLPPEQGGCRIAVVGVEHDGLLLLARYWPRCTEVGYVRGVSAEAYQRIEGFQLLHRSPGHTWIVHASLSSNMCFLGLTVWQPVFAEEGGAEGSGVSAAPKQTVESEGPYQAFVLRVDAPVPRLPEPEPESGPPQRAVGAVAAAAADDSGSSDLDEKRSESSTDGGSRTPRAGSINGDQSGGRGGVRRASLVGLRQRQAGEGDDGNCPSCLGPGAPPPHTVEIRGLHVISWEQPSIHFLNSAPFAEDCPARSGTPRDPPWRGPACSFLLCHQGIKHFLVRGDGEECTHEHLLVRHFVWRSYNPSHRLLYYIAVTGAAGEYILNCYSFLGGRPELRFDTRLKIDRLPEVRTSRMSAAQRRRRASRDSLECDTMEAGLETWDRPGGAAITPHTFTIVRLRGAAVCLCHQHVATVGASELPVTIYMLHRHESVNLRVPVPVASAVPRRRLYFAALADYVIIHAAGVVLQLVDCSQNARSCSSISVSGRALVPVMTQETVDTPVTRASVRSIESDVSLGEAEYHDALDQPAVSAAEQSGTAQAARLAKLASREAGGTTMTGAEPPPAAPPLLPSPPRRDPPKSEVNPELDLDLDLPQSPLRLEPEPEPEPEPQPQPQPEPQPEPEAAPEPASEPAPVPAPEPAPSPALPRVHSEASTFSESSTTYWSPENIHPLHLLTVPWLDELPLDQEPEESSWGGDCFILALDCESGCAFRMWLDPDAVVALAVASSTCNVSPSAQMSGAIRGEGVATFLIQLAWLHLRDQLVADMLVRELIGAHMLHHSDQSSILREYLLCATDTVLRRQFMTQDTNRLLNELLARDRNEVEDHGSKPQMLHQLQIAESCERTGDAPELPSPGLSLHLSEANHECAPFPAGWVSPRSGEMMVLPPIPASPAGSAFGDATPRDPTVSESPSKRLRNLAASTPRDDFLPPIRPMSGRSSSVAASPFTPRTLPQASPESSAYFSNLAIKVGEGGTGVGSSGASTLDVEQRRQQLQQVEGGRQCLLDADKEAERLQQYVANTTLSSSRWQAVCKLVATRFALCKWEQSLSLCRVLELEVPDAIRTLGYGA
jgi:hypothetical protein